MLFDNLILENFGVFEGRHEIDLKTSPPQKTIILIGALNGAGKTTILDALQLVLYGKFARCSKRGNQAYEKFLKKSINKNVSFSEGALLELAFRFTEEGNEQKYTIRRKWNQAGKTLKEIVEVFKNDNFDSIITESWSEYIEDIIPVNISHLFFFDGEKIEAYADQNNSSELLGTAIHSLLGLDLVKQLQTDLQILERKQRIELKPRPEQEAINVLEKELNTILKQRQVIAQNKASKITLLEQLQRELDTVELDLKNTGGDRLKEKEHILMHRENIANQIEDVQESLRDHAGGISPLLLVKDHLCTLSLQAAREKETLEAKIIHNKLDNRDQDLLTHLKQKKTSNDIINFVSSYLEADRSALLKKSNIPIYLNLSSSAVIELESLLKKDLEKNKNDLTRLLVKLSELQGQLVTIDRKLESIPDEASIAQLLKTEEKLKDSTRDLKLQIDELEQIYSRKKKEEEKKIRERDRLIKSAVKTDIENDDINRTIDYAAKTVNTLKLFQDSLTNHHSRNISCKVLECFKQLIHKDTLIKELYIDPKNCIIEIRDSSGHLISPGRLSAGERQLLATSILWALAEVSGRLFPVIIDTPLGRLDSKHRAFLAERYFPNASHQVILLSTDEEIDGELLKVVEHKICHKYLLSYTDETSSSHIKQGYFF